MHYNPNFPHIQGEWKFPGGVQEESDSSLLDTALRELQEEFLGVELSVCPQSPCLYMMSQKLTIPIQSKQYLMHNFIAFESENAWIDKGTCIISSLNQSNPLI